MSVRSRYAASPCASALSRSRAVASASPSGTDDSGSGVLQAPANQGSVNAPSRVLRARKGEIVVGEVGTIRILISSRFQERLESTPGKHGILAPLAVRPLRLVDFAGRFRSTLPLPDRLQSVSR